MKAFTDTAGFRKQIKYTRQEKIDLFKKVRNAIITHKIGFREAFKMCNSFLTRHEEIWLYRPDNCKQWDEHWYPLDEFHIQIRIDIINEEIERLINKDSIFIDDYKI